MSHQFIWESIHLQEIVKCRCGTLTFCLFLVACPAKTIDLSSFLVTDIEKMPSNIFRFVGARFDY